MSEVIVYHGGTGKVEFPVCKFGRRNLDFGQGFYVTDLRQQAVDWATQVADRRNETPIINRYRLNRDAILGEARCKVFTAYDRDWLLFIVASRRGEPVADNYDYIDVNGRTYARNSIFISIVVKKSLSDESEETPLKIEFDGTETI